MVRTAVPEAVTLVGEKLAATPGGSPLALNATGALKPLSMARLTMKVVDWPGLSCWLEGARFRVKSAGSGVKPGGTFEVGDEVGDGDAVGVVVWVDVGVWVGVWVGVGVCV